MKEADVLVQVFEDISILRRKLDKFRSVGYKYTIDIYYYDEMRNELKPSETGEMSRCFRLRQKEFKIYMTYKVDVYGKNNEWLYCNEHEVEVSNFHIAQQIVDSLGLKELVRIDNRKEIYEGKNHRILLEEVKDLGLFLQVEKHDVSDDISDEGVMKIKDEIRKFISTLGIQYEEQTAGKPELMLRKRGECR